MAKLFKNSQSGFTLVELTVATMVIAVGIIGVVYLMTQAGTVGRRVKDKDAAYELISKKIELLRDIPFVDLAEGDSYFTVDELQESAGVITTEFIDSPTNHLKKITVVVAWERWGSDSTQSESLVTYRTRDGLGLRSY